MKKTSLFTLLLIILSPIMVYAIDVIPSGEATGIIVMTDGVLITDTAKVTDQCEGGFAKTCQCAAVDLGK